MQRMIGDNVFWLTLFIGFVLILATLGIILNILIRDGSYVPNELNFLEGLVGAGVGLMSLLNAWHHWLWHRRQMAGKGA